MKQMTCEMCGSTDLIKQDGVFVCQACGTKYSVEDAKQLLKEVEDVVRKVESTTETVNEAANIFKSFSDNLAERNNELFTLLPQKDEEESQYHLLEYLRDSDYIADDIFDDFSFDETESAVALIAIFGGPITYHWTASSGYDRQETYVEYEEKTEWVNGVSRDYKEPVTKTRIVTDWRPSSGTVSDYYANHFVVGTDAFSKEDGPFRRHIGTVARDMQEDWISLWQAYKDRENGQQIYDQLKKSLPEIKKRMIYIAERSSGMYNIPGDHYKDLHDSADFQLETFRLVAYPVVKGKYTYKQQSFDFAVDAINGSGENATADYPAQSDDKEKHDLILAAAEKQKQERLTNNQSERKVKVTATWIIAIVLGGILFLSCVNSGNPPIIFPIMVFVVAWLCNNMFDSQYNKAILKIEREESLRIEQIKRQIQNAKNNKKYLRQESFVKFIQNSGNEKFIEMVKDFVPEEISPDQETEELEFDISELEERDKTNAKNASSMPKGAKICIGICIIEPFLSIILMATGLLDRLPSDLGNILGLGLLIGVPFIFAVIGRLLIESAKDKTGQ